MAAGLLRQRYAARGVDGVVTSAGLLTEGREASGNGVDAMARRGIDISTHRSRLLHAGLLDDVDLIVGMERQHVREVVVLDPDVFPITFTIPELARRARATGPRRTDESPRDWLRRVGSGRSPADMVGDSRADEIADPIGRSARRYEATAVELEGFIDTIVDHLYPAADRRLA